MALTRIDGGSSRKSTNPSLLRLLEGSASPYSPSNPAPGGKGAGVLKPEYGGGVLRRNDQTVAPPSSRGGGNVRNTNTSSGGSGGGDGGAAAAAAAAESRAKKAGKDQTAKQNAATQAIINSLLGALGGYATGRDQQIKNANNALEQILGGIAANYATASGDYAESADRNDQDYDTKTAAIVANRARERTSLLQQAASQGAGETDQLRAVIQAFANAQANQTEADTARADTERQINSQIAGLNAQTEAQRRSAWQQNQEAIGTAWNEYWKNYSDTWTNIQRTGAGNTNIDSDYSTAFTADYDGKDPVKEASRFAGKTYATKNKDDEYFEDFEGRQEGRKGRTVSSQRAGMVTVSAPKRAEGATLRGRW